MAGGADLGFLLTDLDIAGRQRGTRCGDSEQGKRKNSGQGTRPGRRFAPARLWVGLQANGHHYLL